MTVWMMCGTDGCPRYGHEVPIKYGRHAKCSNCHQQMYWVDWPREIVDKVPRPVRVPEVLPEHYEALEKLEDPFDVTPEMMLSWLRLLRSARIMPNVVLEALIFQANYLKDQGDMVVLKDWQDLRVWVQEQHEQLGEDPSEADMHLQDSEILGARLALDYVMERMDEWSGS